MIGVTCSPSHGPMILQHHGDPFTFRALLETVTCSYVFNMSFGNNSSPPKITCGHVCPMPSQAVSVTGRQDIPRTKVAGSVLRPYIYVKHGSRHHTARDIHKWNYLQKRMNRLLKNSALWLRLAFCCFSVQPWLKPQPGFSAPLPPRLECLSCPYQLS